jgi:predicted membrane protein
MQPQSHRRPVNPLGPVIIGLVIITFGLTLLAGNLGWVDAQYVLRQLWPIGLIVAGVGVLLQRRHDKSLWGVVLILAGVWAYAQHWIHVNFWAVFGPTLIVLLGSSFIWRSMRDPRPVNASDAYISNFTIFSGSELRPTAPFQGADLSALLGGAKLDLLDTTMAEDSATIDVFAFMGGIELRVPSDWDVTIKVASIMGACVDKRRPSALPPSKRLIVRGVAMMGGVEIKN